MKYRVQECDVLVVGTGAIGATYARCLAAFGREVVLIDTGPQMRKRPGEHLLNVFRYQHEPNLSLDEAMANHNVFSTPQAYDPSKLPEGAFRPDLKRLNFENPLQDPSLNMPFAGTMYAVGGTFAFWSAFTPIPSAKERTPLIPEAEWVPMINTCIKLMNVHTDAFEPSVLNSCIRDALDAGGVNRASVNMPMGASKRVLKGNVPGSETYYVDWTGFDTILGPFMDLDGTLQPGVQIFERHRAEKLLVEPGSPSRVTGALVRDLRDLEVKEFRAQTVIVAGGSMPSASLLWASGVRPPALGHYLCDNPVASGNLFLSPALMEKARAIPGNPGSNDIVPIPWNDPPPKCGLPPTDDKPWLVHISRTGRSMAFDLAYDVRTVVDVTAYATVESRFENYVAFSDTELDRYGMPQMTFNYSLTDADTALQDRMLQDVEELGALLGVWGKMSRPPFTQGASIQPPGTSLHLTGVTRMGTGIQDSVVDARSCVWGFDNLFVGGQGVLPESIPSNPTFTCCAIAVKSAAAILGVSLQELETRVVPDKDFTDPGMPLGWSPEPHPHG